MPRSMKMGLLVTEDAHFRHAGSSAQAGSGNVLSVGGDTGYAAAFPFIGQASVGCPFLGGCVVEVCTAAESLGVHALERVVTIL